MQHKRLTNQNNQTQKKTKTISNPLNPLKHIGYKNEMEKI